MIGAATVVSAKTVRRNFRTAHAGGAAFRRKRALLHGGRQEEPPNSRECLAAQDEWPVQGIVVWRGCVTVHAGILPVAEDLSNRDGLASLFGLFGGRFDFYDVVVLDRLQVFADT